MRLGVERPELELVLIEIPSKSGMLRVEGVRGVLEEDDCFRAECRGGEGGRADEE